MRGALLSLDAAARRTLDGLLLVWCLFWLVLGLAVGRELWQLSALGDTVGRTGVALDEAGQAVESLARLPLVGETTGRLGREVRETAAEVQVRAAEARGGAQRLAVLVGVAVALAPTVPVAAVYLPLRWRRVRDVRDVRQALAAPPEEREALDAYLAARAVAHVPYARLRQFTPTPLQDARDGRHAALAEAELSRLGLRRAALRAGRPPVGRR